MKAFGAALKKSAKLAAALVGLLFTISVSAAPIAENEELSLEKSLLLRDPFRRLIKKESDDDHVVFVPPLERYDLEKLRLVGVITGTTKNKAMVVDPEDKMHIVHEGMRIGLRRGKILRISKSKLFVEERVVNLLGQEERVESLLELKAKKDVR